MLSGNISAWQSMGIGRKPTDAPADYEGTPIHVPPLVAGRIPFWRQAELSLFLTYGTPVISATVGYYAFAGGREYQGMRQPVNGPTFSQACLTIAPEPLGDLRLRFVVGAFTETYVRHLLVVRWERSWIDGARADGGDGRCLEPGPRASVATATIELLPDGDRCGDDHAAVLRAERNQDWGAIFGDYDLAGNGAPRDASQYEGVALWARASAGSDKSVLVILDDQYTTADAGICDEPEVVEGTRGPELVGQPGVVLPGAVPGENDCGNGFQRVLTVTERWELHLLPFSSFSQEALPNRRLQGIDSSALYGMNFGRPRARASSFG